MDNGGGCSPLCARVALWASTEDSGPGLCRMDRRTSLEICLQGLLLCLAHVRAVEACYVFCYLGTSKDNLFQRLLIYFVYLLSSPNQVSTSECKTVILKSLLPNRISHTYQFYDML